MAQKERFFPHLKMGTIFPLRDVYGRKSSVGGFKRGVSLNGGIPKKTPQNDHFK